MDNKPKMYQNKVDKVFHNNKNVFTTINNKNRVMESNDIRKKISSILNSNDYIYRVNVHILLDSGLIERKIIGIYNNNLVTLNNEYIPIDSIIDIYK